MFDITMQDFLENQKLELKDLYSESIKYQLSNDYYNIVCDVMRQGDVVTQRVYDSLEDNQKWHFNKHYNFRGDKVK